MGQCLNKKECGFQNRDKARFCARCGIPLQGAFLLGRYEVSTLTGKDRNIVTLHAIDRHTNQAVTVRALVPRETKSEERENFLQDAELAASFSANIDDPHSIRVIDYGQDGPVAFLVKSEQMATESDSARPHIVARIGGDIVQRIPAKATPLPAIHSDMLEDEEALTQLRMVIPSVKNGHEAPVIAAHFVIPPQSHTDWLADGNRAYALGQYEEARTAYEKASAADVTSVDAWSGKAIVLFHLGHPEESLAAYDHALSLQPNNPELWTARASVLHELRRFDEEMYCYDQALTFDANYVYAWSGRGMAFAEQGNTEEALFAFDRALLLDPQQSVIWQAMSDTLYALQRYDEALIAIDRALELNTNGASLWDTKGNILRRMKQPGQALPMHERATLLDPQNATAWFDRANDLRDLRRFAEALAVYDQALNLDPTLAGAWYNRGNVLAALRMYEDALESYDSALEV